MLLFARSLVALAAMTAVSAATAIPVTFNGSGTGPGPVPVTAQAIFDIIGNSLSITLINTSPSNAGQDVPGSTLTGLFFDLTGSPSLTPVSASVLPGGIVQGANCDINPPANGDNAGNCGAAQTNVGGEFGYQATALTGGADRGIASSGYLTTGLAGNIGNFNNGAAGTNLDNPDSLDGINFGIISAAAGFNPNGGTDVVPLINDRVMFLLTGVSGLTNADISHVSFQYGTALTELNVPGVPVRPDQPVPEPASLALLGMALASLALARRKSR